MKYIYLLLILLLSQCAAVNIVPLAIEDSNKNKNILETNKIEISNKNNRIFIKGEYNYSNNFIDIILNLSQNNEIYLTTLIKGNLNNPNISFDKNSKFFQNSNSNENNMIEESVIQFLNNFFDFND